MQKKYMIIVVLMAFATSIWAQKQIVILHTNDTHSTILPNNPNLNNKTIAGKGGFLRRVALLKEERQACPDLLLFDSGDFSQGSPYYNIYKGEVEVQLMNMMGYDAATIGNHEFDFGLDNMAKIFRMATFPIVCANYDVTGTVLEGLVKPYVVIKRNGVKIGVFGLSPMLDGLVENSNCAGVTYLDPIATSNKMVDILRNKEKCDMVICLSHIGWDTNNGPNDQETIAGTRGIDLVLGGHSHTYFEELRYVNDLDGRAIPVDQNGKHGIWIGKMTIDLKKK